MIMKIINARFYPEYSLIVINLIYKVIQEIIKIYKYAIFTNRL